MFARRRSLRLITGLALAMCALAVTSTDATAQRQKNELAVGDMAPSLSGLEFVQGEFSEFEHGKTYIVEFWATWCAPCRAAIPKLNAKYRSMSPQGLEVVAISDEEMGTVDSFVRRQGSNMSYPVAVDAEKQANKAWMQAAKRKGIPSAFVVAPTGRIAFIGNPHSDTFSFVVNACVNDKYDPVLFEKAIPLFEQGEKARELRDWVIYERALDRVLELDQWVFSEAAMKRYHVELVDRKSPERAGDWAESLIERYSSRPDVLRDIAIYLTDGLDLPEYDVARARLAVERMAAVTESDDPDYLRAKAHVLFREGKVDEAIDTQFTAFMNADPAVKSAFKYDLDRFRNASGRSAERQNGRRSGRR